MHPVSILMAAAAYWLLGALWYSALFGGVWSGALERQGIKLADPTRAQLTAKLVGTFAANLATAAAMALVLHWTRTASLYAALHTGLVTGLGFSAASLAVAYSWESKPIQSFLVDAGYHVLGCVLCAVIITAWPS